jgi:hypothetical protein
VGDDDCGDFPIVGWVGGDEEISGDGDAFALKMRRARILLWPLFVPFDGVGVLGVNVVGSLGGVGLRGGNDAMAA